ncbi:MAG: MmgE/PrpD family protein [Thermodesulfobacteriota bacterium]|nr:MmgE/PrpD family protein [Thermodesulfobacteriota bacterium]
MYAKKIAEFVGSLSYEDLPREVIVKTKECTRDHVGCILGAYPLQEAKMIAEWARDLGDRPESTILGFGYKTSCRNAALANGYLSEVLEMQDGLTSANMHPASCVQPAALALAECLKKGPKEFITAVVAGYEVGNRVAESLPAEKSTGTMKTGTAGTFASAAAAGKLLGLNVPQLINALGIAGFLLPLSTRENVWGTTIKPAHPGQASMVGIESALLAQKGFTGCQEIFMGTPPRHLGFCNVISQDPLYEKLIEGLGEKYTIMDVYYKPYSACRLSHSAVEAALALVQENVIDPAMVQKIEVKTYARASRELGKRFPNPESSISFCQFSIPYLMASVVWDRAISPKSYTREKISNPKILELAKLVEVTADEAMTRVYPEKAPARVRIILRNGTSFEKQVDVLKWEPSRGIPVEEQMAKYYSLAAEVLSREKAEMVAQKIHHLERVEISDLMKDLVK